MNKPPILEITGVSKSFVSDETRLSVLADVSFSVQEDRFVCIVGPSGAGKSTLLKIIAGFVKPDKGFVRFADIPSMPDRLPLAMVFQNFALFPWLTALGNVEFGLKMMGMDEKKRKKQALEKIELMGLAGFERSYPDELSDGMKQRVGFARALAVSPEVLLMDEPFSALDAFTAQKLRHDLLRIWAESKMTVIMVTHLVDEAIELSDEIVVVSSKPSTVEKIIHNALARPRDRRSREYMDLADRVTIQIGP